MPQLVKVRLLVSMAGAETFPAGSILETTTTESTSLISHGYAELVKEEVRTASNPKAETRQTTAKRIKKK
jgi:hypothetical protein